MESNERNWFKRQEVKRITADWVKVNCHLTDREKELLKLISERKLVRRDHLEVISPSYRHLPNRTRLINRAIKKMYKRSVLDKVHEPSIVGKGNSPSVVAVDKAGSMLLEKNHRPRIIQQSVTYRGNDFVKRRLPITYRHTNGINQVEVDTILFCEKNNIEIVEWQIEKPRTYYYNGEKKTLIPDILMILKLDNLTLPFFIEYDTGSEGKREKEPQVIKDKIINYNLYKIMNLWKEEEWQKHFTEPQFPIILFVTEDDDRMPYFDKIASMVKLKGIPVYNEKYAEVLDGLLPLFKSKNSPEE